MLPIIFLLPMFQLFVLVHAATFEVKNIKLYVSDSDGSQTSRAIISAFRGSPQFNIVNVSRFSDPAKRAIETGEAKAALIVPSGFESSIYRKTPERLQLIINAVDGSAAGIIQNYAQSTITPLLRETAAKLQPALMAQASAAPEITTIPRYLFNPELNYKYYMTPGILAVLVTVVGMFLAAMNIVKEKEVGTIEQLNVTPLARRHFIIGKLLPFWIIALFELALGLAFGRAAFHIPLEGDFFTLFVGAGLYLLVVQSFGLMISTISQTQQQAMFIAWFFTIIFILLGGLFTPISSMPEWAQKLTMFNPVAYFIEILRRNLIKGAGFADVKNLLIGLAVYATAALTVATLRYSKTSH